MPANWSQDWHVPSAATSRLSRARNQCPSEISFKRDYFFYIVPIFPNNDSKMGVLPSIFCCLISPFCHVISPFPLWVVFVNIVFHHISHAFFGWSFTLKSKEVASIANFELKKKTLRAKKQFPTPKMLIMPEALNFIPLFQMTIENYEQLVVRNGNWLSRYYTETLIF